MAALNDSSRFGFFHAMLLETKRLFCLLIPLSFYSFYSSFVTPLFPLYNLAIDIQNGNERMKDKTEIPVSCCKYLHSLRQ
jgi:hypothetical protein